MGYPTPNPPPSITDKSAKYYLSDSLKTVVDVSGNIDIVITWLPWNISLHFWQSLNLENILKSRGKVPASDRAELRGIRAPSCDVTA